MTDTAPSHQPAPDKDKRVVLLIYILYFIGLPTIGATSLAGVIIAHLKANEVADPWRSHLDYQIRTFWLSIAIAIVGSILMLLLVGWFVLLLLPLWILIRCIKGFLVANDNRPIEDPKTMLW